MFGFDLKTFSGAKHSGMIEKGEYTAMIEKMEWLKSEAGDYMLVATLSILLAHGGKKVIKDYFHLCNSNKQAAEISASRLADLTVACGLADTPSDARVYEGMKSRVKVGIDSKGFNTIERYMYWFPTDNTPVLNVNLARLALEGNEVTEYQPHYSPEDFEPTGSGSESSPFDMDRF